jgi:hypothetical protein
MTISFKKNILFFLSYRKMNKKNLNQNSLKQLLSQGFTRGHIGKPNMMLSNNFSKHKEEMVVENTLLANPVKAIFNGFSADRLETKFKMKDRLLRLLPLREPAVKKLHSAFEEIVQNISFLVLGDKLLEAEVNFNSEPLHYIYQPNREYMEIASNAKSTIQANHIDYASS